MRILNLYLSNIDKRCDWPKWQEAIQSELNSLAKREVFGPLVHTLSDVKPIGYKWVFVLKEMREMRL